MSPYQAALGEDFVRLHPTLQAFYLRAGMEWRGVADVYWTPNPLLRALLRFTPMPRAGQQVALTFRLLATGPYDIWERQFAGRPSVSRQWGQGRHIVEQFGPGRILLTSTVIDGTLVQSSCGVRLLGIPLPSALAPRISARQWAVGNAQHFDVHMRLFGSTVLRYTGHLHPSP